MAMTIGSRGAIEKMVSKASAAPVLCAQSITPFAAAALNRPALALRRLPMRCARAQMRPLLANSTAIGRVPGNSENIMVMMVLIGSARPAAGMPQSSHHTARLMMMAKRLKC
jgi:hypothetical protein